MNWDDLRVLLEVSRSTTMTQTARRLGVNQTTVSRRLGALEQALGVELVLRYRDGVTLTEAGLKAVRAVEGMETAAHDLERDLVGGDTRLAGSLRITTIDMISNYHPDLFSSFASRYPEVEIELHTSYDQRSLARREADLAIRWTSRPDEGLFGRKLARAEYAIYASAELVRAHGRRAKLSSFPWLAWSEASGARKTSEWMQGNVPDARIVCRYDYALSMHAAIRAGCGIGFMPCVYADGDPGLVRLRGVQAGFGYDLWCLTHLDLSRTGRVRAFLAHAGEYFDARGRAYAGKGPRAKV
ncbi:MAG: LysR family transcriptional regulator [Myxococcota bacterium]